MTKPDVDLAALAALASDDQLAARARDLAERALDRAFYHLEHGTPANELAVIKLMAPVFTKLLEAKGESEELAEMRDMIVNLRAAVLGHSE